MGKLTVLVDMDDVLDNLLDTWCACLNKRYSLNVKPVDITSWSGLTDAYNTLTGEQVYSPIYEDEFWKTVEPIPGSVRFMKKLVDDGHNVYIVTSSNYQTIKSKMEDVLFKYYPFIDWNHVIIAQNKQMVRGDVLIDDAPHNHIGGRYIKILMDAPHNRNFDDEEYGMIRVKSWREIYNLINTLSEVIEWQE